MKKIDKIMYGILLYSSFLHAQLGIGTATPQEMLHVNGTLQVTNGIYIGGNANSKGSPGSAGQVLRSNGPGEAPAWQELPVVPESTGTVIVAGGKFIVAQEIIVQMSADFSGPALSGSSTPLLIGNLNNKVIDNSNTYNGNDKTNSFRVLTDGIYQIDMNLQLATASGTVPAIGLWNDTLRTWVARVNDYFYAPFDKFQTTTLMTSVELSPAYVYSFRIGNKAPFTIKQLSGGETGKGPVTQVSVKRLR
ncbi:hypothetical protein [Flavobacterium hercynium]|uniref:C1q domain-containing protein n=1 Tax=Flavobacterium hercynium TaxID=387094 RepID=A0A226HFU3_9FLAO|nr:hypothetical protein [Flavobacterium hercynium]OXA93143.1 hypothetical protein B0A66_07665 [Flavobacterium hercynium]SMP32674.1 hypothetical protein SAMN06265346_11580 [Flavobacterium hercynium]